MSQTNIRKKEKSQTSCDKSSTYAEHQKLINEILKEIGAVPWCRVWKNATGTALAIGSRDEYGEGGRFISFGLKGSADILGILSGGTFLAIEVKTGKAVQTKEQKNFMKMIQGFGGEYVLARDVPAVLTALQRYKFV